MKPRTTISLAAGLTGFVAFVAMGTQPPAPVAAPPDTSTLSTSPVPSCAYAENDVLAYALRSEVSSAHADEANEDRFSALLSLRVMETDEDGATLRAALSNVRLQQRLSHPEDRVTHPLEAGFEIDVAPDCRIEALRLPSDWSPAAGLLVAGLLGLHEYVVQPENRWETMQTDGVGLHRARYQRRGATVERRKLSYASAGLEVFGMTLSLPVSEASARFDDRGLTSSSVRERLRITVGDEVRADLLQRSSMVADHGRYLEPPVATALALWEPGALAIDDALPAAPSDAAALAALYEDLVGRLSQWTVRDARAMASLLVARPELMAELVALLQQDELDGGQRASVFWALELAGTPAAKEHLVDLLGAPLPHDRIRAASALASAGNASVGDGEALLALHRDDDDPSVAASALLAFGALSEKASPEVKAYVREKLEAELGAADSSASARVALQAIGNSGDADALESAATYLADPDPDLRATAASALRRMGRAAVAPLQAALDGESSGPTAAVMARTLAGLGAPSEADIAWVGARLASNSDGPLVRKPLIGWIGSASTAEAQTVLAAHFHQEPSSEVRQWIGRFVPVEALVQ